MPMAKAAPSMTLNPSYGPPGTWVTVYGFGFDTNSQVAISIFTTQLGSLESSCDVGDIATQIQIPTNVNLGSYPVTATDGSGNTVSATFTVTMGTPPPATAAPTTSSAATPAPQPSQPAGSIWSYPTALPTQASSPKGGSAFSPLLIVVIIVVVVALLVPMTLFYRRRSGGEALAEEAPATSMPGPSTSAGMPPAYGSPQYARPVATTSPAVSRYPASSYSQQLTRPTMAPRPSMSRFGGMTATRMCPGCKRPVKDYYSVCPYCHRKLK